MPHPRRPNRKLVTHLCVQPRLRDTKTDLPQELSLLRHERLQFDEHLSGRSEDDVSPTRARPVVPEWASSTSTLLTGLPITSVNQAGVSSSTRGRNAHVRLHARRVSQLVEELVVVVAVHEIVRHRNPDGRRDGHLGIRPLREAFESRPHQRNDPRQPLDDLRRLDVDHAQPGIGLLVLDDDPQGRVQLLVRGKACGGFGHGLS